MVTNEESEVYEPADIPLGATAHGTEIDALTGGSDRPPIHRRTNSPRMDPIPNSARFRIDQQIFHRPLPRRHDRYTVSWGPWGDNNRARTGVPAAMRQTGSDDQSRARCRRVHHPTVDREIPNYGVACFERASISWASNTAGDSGLPIRLPDPPNKRMPIVS